MIHGLKWRRRYPGRATPPLTLVLAGGLVAGAVLIPLAYLLLRTTGVGDKIGDLLFSPRTLQVLANSAFMALVVAVLATVIAVPLAYLTVRTDLPGRRFWSVVTALPLAIPSYVGSFAFIAVFGPRGSILQSWLAPFGIERLPPIYGWPGTVLVLTLFTYPFILLTVRGSLRNLDPRLEEAARTLGHGHRSTWLRVTLPHLRPAILAGSLLVALYALSDFGTPSLMRFPSFTREIFIQYQLLDRSMAAVLSVVLVVLVSVVLFLELSARGKARYYTTGSGTRRPAGLVTLGRWRWPALVFSTAIVSLALFLPLGVILHWFLRGFLAGASLTPLLALTLNSTLVSALASLMVVAAGLPIALLVVRYRGTFSHLAERATYIGFAMPGIVVALSLVFFGANYATPIYQTLPLLIFAYVVLFVPLAVGTLRSSLMQVNPHVEEAARSLGHGFWHTIRSVTVPLTKAGFVTGIALVFLSTVKELPATLILAPIGFSTLATRVWSATEEALFAQAGAAALALVAISAVVTAVILLDERFEETGRGST